MKDHPYDTISHAIDLAVRSHRGQLRKDGRTPALNHSLRVALKVASMGAESAVIAAAVLHDVIEDTPASWDTVRDEVGERVAEQVQSLSEDKRLPRTERRPALLERLPHLPQWTKIIKLADVLDNLHDLKNLDWSEEKQRRFLRDCRLFWEACRNGSPDLASEVDDLLCSLERREN